MDIVVISGFLGAGKTTFVLHLARRLVEDRGRKVAIIENEAGKVGVDDARLRDAGLSVREVFGGCVCCSMGANLMMTLQQLAEQTKPDVVIVEPSGVASPGGITQLLKSCSVVERVKMAVLFDAERFRAFHRVAGPFIEDALRSADVVVVNKIDLVDAAAVTDLVDRLVQMGGGKPVVAMSAKTGQGVERLLTELIGEKKQMDVFTGFTLAPVSRTGHLLPGAGGHNHAGEPGVYAAIGEMRFERPRAVEAVIAEAAVMLERLAKAIDATDGAVIGHVKAKLETDAGDVFLSTTSSARPPEVTGDTNGMTRRAQLTLNVLAYRVSDAELERMTGGICDL